MKFSCKPRAIRLDQIESWLEEEHKASGFSFIVNIDVIKKAFKEKRFHCITKGDETLAFCVFQSFGQFSKIDIAVVDYKQRHKGIGRFMIDSHCEYMVSQGVKAVDLTCTPRSSSSFWENIGFSSVPVNLDRNYKNDSVTYKWKAIIDACVPSSEDGPDGRVELWDAEPWEAKNKMPRWSWPLDLNKISTNPIVAPANRDWRLKWSKGHDIIIDEKFKYFSKQSRKNCEYLIIDSKPIAYS